MSLHAYEVIVGNVGSVHRAEHGDGDPGKGRHRPDDPETVQQMLRGNSA